MDKQIENQIKVAKDALQDLLLVLPRLSNSEKIKIVDCIKVLSKRTHDSLYVPKGHLTLPELSRMYTMRLGDMSVALLTLKSREPQKYKRVKIPGLGHFSYVYAPVTIEAVEKYVKEIKNVV